MISLKTVTQTATGVSRYFRHAGVLLLGIVPLSLTAQLFTPGVTEPIGSGPTNTTTHYIDFDNGSESNTGTSSNSPWKYAPGMPDSQHNADAVPGRVYALARGSTWRLTGTWNIPASGTAGNPIVFTAYGTAADLPRVTVLMDLKALTWTSGGGTNVYNTSVPGTEQVRRLYVNKVAMGQAWSSAWVGNHSITTNWVGQPRTITCTRLPYPNPDGIVVGQSYNTGITKYWRQTTDLTNKQPLYFYNTSGAPSTLTSLEGLVASINATIACNNKSYVYIDRLDLSGGALGVITMDASSSATPTDVRVTNCNIWGAKKAGIRVWSSSTVSPGFSSGVIKWNRVDSGEGITTKPTPDDATYGADAPVYTDDGVMGESEGIAIYNGVRDWEISQNDVSNFWHTNITVTRTFDKDTTAGLNDNAAVVITGNNVIEHNNSHSENVNYSHGIEIVSWEQSEAIIARHDGATVAKNWIYNMPAGSSLKAQNVLYYGNLIAAHRGSPRDPYDNTAWNGEAVVIFGYDKPGGATISGGVIAYNTFVNCRGAGVTMAGNSDGAVPTGFVVANNIMAYCGYKYPSSELYVAFHDLQTNTSNIEVDNNLMYSPSTTNVYRADWTSPSTGGSTTTVSGMESLESTWNNNIGGSGANPLFTSYVGNYTQPGSPTDYILQSGSPARAAGVIKALGSALPEDTSGWTNLGCWQDTPGTSATTFVTGQTLSSTNWNDYTGWKGMKITTGSDPIVVTDLGRWVLSGNSQTHTLKIVNASGTTVGSTSVALSGATPVQFKYAALTNPVTLSANSVYYIASQETNGGDYLWGSSTALSHTGVAAINNAARSTDGITFSNDSSTDNCHGPLSFKYYIETNFVTSTVNGVTPRNDFTGWKGMKITVGSTPLIVTQLARWKQSGNTQTHTLAVFNNSGTSLASVSLNLSSAPVGLNYVALSTPVVLAANTVYYIVSSETNAGDAWGGSSTTVSHTSTATVNGAYRSGDGVTWTADDATADHCNVPVGFTYY
jgi:hypothetical protein